MSALLLATKLYMPPRRPTLVARDRLIQKLNQSLQPGVRLTLVAAPAGFGKTTIISEWLNCVQRPAAWVSLDSGDNDPVRFWTYVIAALNTRHTVISDETLALLSPPQQLSIESLLTLLVNGLAALPEPVILALDDYHLIETPAIHQTLTFLVDHLPPQLHLVIASRADPPLPLARLRARGELMELRAADLRFTHEEAAAFLENVLGSQLAPEVVAALEERTEGWIAGLQLAALSMQGREDVQGFMTAFTGSHRYILSYLADEVLRQQPANVQQFLLETSMLERLTASLCGAVTGREGSQDVLDYLARANLFTIALDDEGRWFRYHHLFADVLRHRLKATYPERLTELHLRASRWYEAHDFMPDAVLHALAVKGFDRAAHLIETLTQTLLARGETTTMRRWLDTLPDDIVRARYRLSLAYAWVHALSAEYDRLEGRVDDAERSLSLMSDSTNLAKLNSAMGEILVLRAGIASYHHDIPRAIELCHRALDILPGDNLILRALASMSLGEAYRAYGDSEAASRFLTQALILSRQHGHVLIALGAISNLADLYEAQGQLRQVAHSYRQALQFATERSGRPLPAACIAYCGLAKVLREWNDLDDAEQYLNEALRLAREAGIEGIALDSVITLALVKRGQGDFAEARRLLDEAMETGWRWGFEEVPLRIGAFQARLALAEGDLESASRWAHESGVSPDEDLREIREIELTTLARILIAEGALDDARRLLARLLPFALGDGRIGRVIEVRALQALACRAQGDDAAALANLEAALTLAEPEGYVRIFADEGAPMLAMLKQLVRRSSPVAAYAGRLLVELEGEHGERARASDPAASNPSGAALDEPLSERELEVLQLIAEGYSNEEIADTLFLSKATVKKHVTNIFGKMDVHSRTQALARARDLGILE